MTRPLVTIGIPTVSRAAYLIEAVDAALNQTWSPLEVLIGDDGESAEIFDWCQRRSAEDGRLRYQRNPHRRGLAGNWNAIAASAAGEFIVLPGDDDRLLPDFVERAMAVVTPASSVVFSNHHIIDDSGRRLPEETSRTEQEYHRAALAPGQVADPAICAWRLSICPSAALIRRGEILRLGFRDELNSPDVEFFIRLAGEGARFDFVADRLVEFRRHTQGTATASGLRHEALLARLLTIDVPANVEPVKHELISRLIVNAVSRCLHKRDWQTARDLLRSPYYPRSSRLVSRCTQQLCAGLPKSIGAPIYQAIASIKRAGSSR
ncbi:unnamed protein product [uncultured bacterium]|nr:unnamed protein product [uncultured bacterium]